MRTGSRINREQQVKVVIRLRPDEGESRLTNSVYISELEQNELVVETGSKKQIFVFDHVAPPNCSQLDIYRMIGRECVELSLEGYNCCIFAYGQTGAGKTYSVLGNINDISTDIYSESRGILPRLLEEVFDWLKDHEGERNSVTCSYMEIYNQQIFDLLSSDKRIHQIRQDFKKGVFVEGLIERRIGSYKGAIQLLLEGERTRRTASTTMNSESSRSHAIFTILLESQIVQEQNVKVRKAKINIIDLAGSERVKHTHVEGERLREGCNINRSLHVLGNVINSLVESTKKKKHIPFRDSKLTHYLKDSLGGNSITKLLANVHCNRQYLGDTLSTLMFAKRAKILKMKVELNESSTENFDALRKEVRRLREQLAQARYFKNETRISQRGSFDQDEPIFQKITDNLELQVNGGRTEALLLLEQNELHYKSLIEIYEEHMKTCSATSNTKRKQSINIVSQWRNLERRNTSLTHLLRRVPAFTKIYRQNILLRQERVKFDDEASCDELKVKRKIDLQVNMGDLGGEVDVRVHQMLNFYQRLIGEMQSRFQECLQGLQRGYQQLQNECRVKERKIKQLKKKKEYPPDIQELKNENEYLQLNILDLENQINQLQENDERKKFQIKESKKNTARKVESKQEMSDADEDEISSFILQRLRDIRRQAQRQGEAVDEQKVAMQTLINQLQTRLSDLTQENNKLHRKYSGSKSPQKRSSMKDEPPTVCPYDLPRSGHKLSDFREDHRLSQHSILSVDNEMKNLHQSYSKEILSLKMQIKCKQKEIADLRKNLQEYASGDRKIEDEFGKTLNEIIQQYRQNLRRQLFNQSKSMRNIHKNKQLDYLVNKIEVKVQQKGRMSMEVGRAGKQITRKEQGKQSKKTLISHK